jgi:hypothetical protein
MITSEVMRLIIFIFRIKNREHAKISIPERLDTVLWAYIEGTTYER